MELSKHKSANISKLIIVILLLSDLAGISQVKVGAERPELYLPFLKYKTIGIVANNASVVAGVNIVDTLRSMGVEIKRIFSPEHGFRRFEEAGQTIKSSVDSATGIPVVSLYGKKKKPEKNDLKDLDMMVFDLQDVGVRFYTYIATLTYVMEACSANNIPLMVFDRPNPNGFYIDGPVLDSAFSSFAGLHPVPVVYGMTIGEYAKMVNEEGWLTNAAICELKVIPLENYTHRTLYHLPGKPSPNLPEMTAVYLYPSLCFFEGTVISVGRGTQFPFEVFGHPAMKGFSFSFTPQSIKDMAQNPPSKGEICLGLDLRDFYATHPKMLGRINLSWLIMAFRDMGSNPNFFNDYFDKLAGNSLLRKQLLEGLPESEIRKTWKPGIEKFREIRSKYLLYPE